VILIGDAPANTQEDVIFKRASKGENYWSKTRFAKMAVYSKEIVNLQQNNVPIHAFYVAGFAKRNFQEIANLTGGRCEPLDINSSAGAVTLTNLVTEVLLSNIGQQNGKGDALVDAYRNKFIKSYNNRGGRNIFKITDNNS